MSNQSEPDDVSGTTNLETARAFLKSIEASPRLLNHAEIVERVAGELVRSLRQMGCQIDEGLVRSGALLHDVGKVLHPEELLIPGHEHEYAGKRLLLDAGFSERVANACVWHSCWNRPGLPIEFLVIALADKLWKGKREGVLETLLIQQVSDGAALPQWEVFQRLDSDFETIASLGHERVLASISLSTDTQTEGYRP